MFLVYLLQAKIFSFEYIWVWPGDLNVHRVHVNNGKYEIILRKRLLFNTSLLALNRDFLWGGGGGWSEGQNLFSINHCFVEQLANIYKKIFVIVLPFQTKYMPFSICQSQVALPPIFIQS